MKSDRLNAQDEISALDSHLYLQWWQCLIMQNMMSLSASLAMSGDSISYSPTLSPLQKEGRTSVLKMRFLGSDSSCRSQGHNTPVKGKLCCAGCLHAATKSSPVSSVPGRSYMELHLERLKQNFRVPFSKKISPFGLWVKLLAASVSLIVLAFKSGGEIPLDSLEWNLNAPIHYDPSPGFPQPTVFFSWQVLFRLAQQNSY